DRVVSLLQLFRQVGDGRLTVGIPPHRQEQLVLEGGDAGGTGRLLREPKELAQGVSEPRQSPVVGVGRLAHRRNQLYRNPIQWSTMRRLLLLCGLAAVLGFVGGGAAWVLLHLIALITNAALFHRLAWTTPHFADLHPSPLIIVVPVVGALIVSVLAK